MRFIGSDTESQLTREVRAVASGSLPSGAPVVVNSDGTVSVVSETIGPTSAGSETAFNAATTNFTSSTYDSVNEKVVISYQDDSNLGYGTAIVGTVSGTSISFGTPVVFNSGDTEWNSCVYDSVNEKVVIAYRDRGASLSGRAVVGTVSGTSISFGSEVTFDGNTTDYPSCTFDSANGKVVICYRDNSGYGAALVGTVSGTSISFGSKGFFNYGATEDISSVYDSANGKIVVSYRDPGYFGYGTAAVGTVSGTSISFGTEVIFRSSNSYDTSCAYDSLNGKVVIAFRDNGNSNYGKAVVGTVSGTSISFGSVRTFNSATTEHIACTYDVDAQKIVITYSDDGNSQYGTAIVGTVSSTSINFDSEFVFSNSYGSVTETSSVYDSANKKVVIAYKRQNITGGTAIVFSAVTKTTTITAENFLGFTSSAYADTQTATIQSQGAINDKQSGLTPGQAYYVQVDGTLSTTPDNPSVFAGTAVAANKIIVEG